MEFTSDAEYFRKYVWVSAVTGVVAAVVALIAVRSVDGRLTLGGVAVATAIGGLLFVTKLAPVLFCWWHAGRVRYAIESGRVVADVRGRRVLDVPCEEIYLVRSTEPLAGWEPLWYFAGLSAFPRIELRTDIWIPGPPLAVWGSSAPLRIAAAIRHEVDVARAERRRRGGPLEP